MGPFDQWPTGSGFEYFYGFLGCETNQYYPALYGGTTAVEPGKTPEEGYHLTEDMTDKAIGWVRQQKSLMPDKPFFMYYAPGATHAPHHVPEEWADHYRGKFAAGWDVLREEMFARHNALGVIPPDAELTARHAEIPAYDDMPEELKPVLERRWRSAPGSWSTPTTTSAGSSTPSRTSRSPTTPPSRSRLADSPRPGFRGSTVGWSSRLLAPGGDVIILTFEGQRPPAGPAGMVAPQKQPTALLRARAPGRERVFSPGPPAGGHQAAPRVSPARVRLGAVLSAGRSTVRVAPTQPPPQAAASCCYQDEKQPRPPGRARRLYRRRSRSCVRRCRRRGHRCTGGRRRGRRGGAG
jgi:hypothetical protein